MKKDMLSFDALTEDEIAYLIDTAQAIKEGRYTPCFKGKILGCYFFEPSTRTRLSFEAAMKRGGGDVIGFSDTFSTSHKKGESFKDSIRAIGSYVDLLVIRHPMREAASIAAEVCHIPVVNAGDGSHKHPTQMLIDLFTIRESQGRLDGLNLAVVGDLLHHSAAHALIMGLLPYEPRFFFVHPSDLSIPKDLIDALQGSSIPFSFHESVREVIGRVDVVYATPLQKEHFTGIESFKRAQDRLMITKACLDDARNSLRVMHPLPRQEELPEEIDETPFANYFEQAKNGVYLREALLDYLFNPERVQEKRPLDASLVETFQYS